MRLVATLVFVLGMLALGGASTAQDQDVQEGGIKALVRPENPAAAEAEPAPTPKPEPEPKPAPIDPENDPIAIQRKLLGEWERSLNATAVSLADRVRTLAEREEATAEKERALEVRRATLDARVEALGKREAAIRNRAKVAAAVTSPNVPETGPPPSDMVPVTSELKPFKGGKAPTIVGGHAFVIDAGNGRVLHEKDAYEERSVANLQDLMTALIIAEAGGLDEEISISAAATDAPGDKLGLAAGASYTRGDLLKAIMLQPANDAAHALAEDNAGSLPEFVKKMNERGKKLGLVNTVFMTPFGLDTEGQRSTARDVALLAWECYHNEFLRECATTKSADLGAASATNNNELMLSQSYCNGLKLGQSSEARVCLVSSGQKEGRHRIVVVLASTESWVWKDSKVLLEWALKSD